MAIVFWLPLECIRISFFEWQLMQIDGKDEKRIKEANTYTRAGGLLLKSNNGNTATVMLLISSKWNFNDFFFTRLFGKMAPFLVLYPFQVIVIISWCLCFRTILIRVLQLLFAHDKLNKLICVSFYFFDAPITRPFKFLRISYFFGLFCW